MQVSFLLLIKVGKYYDGDVSDDLRLKKTIGDKYLEQKEVNIYFVVCKCDKIKKLIHNFYRKLRLSFLICRHL